MPATAAATHAQAARSILAIQESTGKRKKVEQRFARSTILLGDET
jgi:hypothetical protein